MNKKELSEWVKPAIEPWLNDDDIIKKTKAFFKRD
jgi:regulator of telomere elongation helicase 1